MNPDNIKTLVKRHKIGGMTVYVGYIKIIDGSDVTYIHAGLIA